MQSAIFLFALILAVDIILLVAGLFKPTLVVWWEDTQNRRRVLKIYGRGAVFFGAVLIIMLLLN